MVILGFLILNLSHAEAGKLWSDLISFQCSLKSQFSFFGSKLKALYMSHKFLTVHTSYESRFFFLRQKVKSKPKQLNQNTCRSGFFIYDYELRLRPRPHVAGNFPKRRCFSPNEGTVHTQPAFSGTENQGFQIRSPEWRLLKTVTYRLRVDGRKRRFSNTMTSCLGSRLALWHNYDSEVADLFNMEEKVSVFENTRLRVDGQIRFENATCGRRFF